tara:strand:- start:257 stop:685 length:429 start_codon:yes stop_codon:yes gene_type:complete
MSHLVYYNNCVQLNELFYDSHKQLIERVAKDLNAPDQIDELVKKYLDKPDIKAKKDPNKPKRPKSAFLLFCDQERQKLIEKEKKNLKKGEKFNLGVVQKKLGELWKKLSEDKKAKFNEDCEKQKELYYDKMSEYETSLETNA